MGMTVGDRLSDAFGRDDFEGMIAVLDPEVVWSGYTAAGEEAPVCSSRDEVRAWFQWHIEQGRRALPRIVAETPEKIVVEMNLQEPGADDLHQVLTIREDRIVHIQDCLDRTTALAEAGLEEQPPTSPQVTVERVDASLTQTIPALPVRDAAAAVAFYRDRLGFEVFHHDGGFAVVGRDDAVVHLWEAGDESWQGRDTGDRPVRSGAESFIAGTASCRIRVERVDELYEEMSVRGVLHPASRQGVSDEDYGAREFATLDLDGNLVTFFRWD